MKQKVVIKVAVNGHKSRSKVLKIAVGAPGVQSAGFTGKELDQIEVVGEGIDAAVLTSLLRRNVGPADLVIVDSADKKSETVPVASVPVLAWNSYPYQFGSVPPPVYPIYPYPAEYTHRADPCSIM